MPHELDPIFADPDDDQPLPAHTRPWLESALSFALAVALTADLLLDARFSRPKSHLLLEVGALCTALFASASMWLRCSCGAARPRRRESSAPKSADYHDPIDSDLWTAIRSATHAEAASRSSGIELTASPGGPRLFVAPKPTPPRAASSRGPGAARARAGHAPGGRHPFSRNAPRRA